MDHAFTDQMVRSDKADLTRAVLEYLGRYKGSFQPILAAREAVHEGHELNVAEIRTILNVMRADTSIRLEYTPPMAQIIEFPKRVNFAFDPQPVERPRSLEVLVKGRIKLPYGTSIGKRAEVIHTVSQAKTKFLYKRPGAHSLRSAWQTKRHGWEPLWFERIEVELHWLCKQQEGWNFILLSELEAGAWVAAGALDATYGPRRVCPSCKVIACS